MYNFKEFEKQLSDVSSWLEKEFSSIRTGRATITLLDGVFVEAYGSRMPINQVASISQEDPKTLKISPFDFGQAKSIEKALNEADLGVSVMSGSTGIRVIFPDLTSERREFLVKQAKKKLEEAKISVRKKRDELKKDLQEKQKSSSISEDDQRRYETEMQKKVDDLNKKMDEMLNAKEKEILI